MNCVPPSSSSTAKLKDAKDFAQCVFWGGSGGSYVFDILADDEKMHVIIELTLEFAKECVGVK
ncbi:hypothetical protein EV586_103206 [Tumebacillus sp. BK434]|uniref:hypothetical protein n=1 Tax=Tumebacillus sp. BK434 TaxID=2512169 RepID=UPI001052997A|nr:hypothetical protein [Tumebacillus sp. BK434]TCP55553.1 hypothetical protein EV586_103206 [Tumebacillus sp. BK434]